MEFSILGNLTLQAGDLLAGDFRTRLGLVRGLRLLLPGARRDGWLGNIDFEAPRWQRILVRGQLFRLRGDHRAETLDIFLSLAHAEVNHNFLPRGVVFPDLLKNGDGGCIRIHGIPQTPVALEFLAGLIILIGLQKKIRRVSCKCSKSGKKHCCEKKRKNSGDHFKTDGMRVILPEALEDFNRNQGFRDSKIGLALEPVRDMIRQ